MEVKETRPLRSTPCPLPARGEAGVCFGLIMGDVGTSVLKLLVRWNMMSQLDDNLLKLKTSVEAGVNLASEPEHLSKYVADVVTSNLEDVLRNLRTQVEEPHKLDEAEVGQPNVVIHYTSIAALVSMLGGAADGKGGSSLRLYDSNHFNDPDEGKFFDRNLNLNSKSARELLDATYSPHAYIASFIVPNDRARDRITNAQRDMSDNLVFWRTYGREGLGCSLTLVVQKDLLRKVLYGRVPVRKTGQLLGSVLDSVHECLSPLLELSSAVDIRHRLIRTVAGHVDMIRYLYKSKAYDYERECRIVIPEIDAQKDLIHFEYEEQDGHAVRIKHYYEVDELQVKNTFLTGSLITFGSRVPKPDNARYYLETQLRKAERFYGPKFKTSQISYQVS